MTMPELPATEVSEKPVLDTTGLSLSPGSFQQDLEAIAKRGQNVEAPVATLEPIIEQAPEPTETPTTEPVETQPQVQIPDKFKNPDGTVAVEKIEKSTLSAEQAYEKFREKELALQRKMNEVNRMEKGQIVSPAPVTPAPAVTDATDFEKQINEELAKNQANPGRVLVGLFEAAKAAAYEQATADIRDVRMETAMAKSQRQLEAVAKHDPWVLTEEGMNSLFQIRESKPWLNASPNPMEAAYREHLADSVMSQRVGQQVKTPNPKAPTPPPAAVGAVDRTPKPRMDLNNKSKEELREIFLSQSQDKRDAYFRSLGFK